MTSGRPASPRAWVDDPIEESDALDQVLREASDCVRSLDAEIAALRARLAEMLRRRRLWALYRERLDAARAARPSCAAHEHDDDEAATHPSYHHR